MDKYLDYVDYLALLDQKESGGIVIYAQIKNTDAVRNEGNLEFIFSNKGFLSEDIVLKAGKYGETWGTEYTLIKVSENARYIDLTVKKDSTAVYTKRFDIDKKFFASAKPRKAYMNLINPVSIENVVVNPNKTVKLNMRNLDKPGNDALSSPNARFLGQNAYPIKQEIPIKLLKVEPRPKQIFFELVEFFDEAYFLDSFFIDYDVISAIIDNPPKQTLEIYPNPDPRLFKQPRIFSYFDASGNVKNITSGVYYDSSGAAKNIKAVYCYDASGNRKKVV